MLQLYAESANGMKPVAVEQPFELDLADPETGELLDVRLRGIIDLVEEGETLVDLKTAGRTLEQGGLERHLQLSTYALAFFLLHGVDPEAPARHVAQDREAAARAARDHPHASRTSAGRPGSSQRGREPAIETEHFFPNPSWRCTECEYFAHCQRWRGTWPLPSEQLVTVSVEPASILVPRPELPGKPSHQW